jgi:hypothetical protein
MILRFFLLILPFHLFGSSIDLREYVEKNIFQLDHQIKIADQSDRYDSDYYYILGRLTSYLDIREIMNINQDEKIANDLQDKLNNSNTGD